jgi:hypothetical protein
MLSLDNALLLLVGTFSWYLIAIGLLVVSTCNVASIKRLLDTHCARIAVFGWKLLASLPLAAIAAALTIATKWLFDDRISWSDVGTCVVGTALGSLSWLQWVAWKHASDITGSRRI